MEEFVEEDCRTLFEQANLQEEELRNKRRWLMGLPTSKNEAGQLTESKFQPERPIPESLLREDDVFYETIRSFVKKLVEKHDSKNKSHLLHGDMQLTHSPTDITTLLSLINDMTNQSLFQFAKLLTGGSVKIERTRWKMKQIIKIHLKKNNTRCIKLSKDHLSLLRNPKSFQWNPESRFIPDSGSSHSAVQNILNILEHLPTQTLSAMNRKLRGIKDYIPKLTPSKSGINRAWLIKGVRKKCSKFLSKLKKGDPLQEPLAKAMEVAGLTLKLTERHPYTPNFIQFPRKTIVLQNEIATCINLLDENVSIKLRVLKKIQKLLDPNGKTSGRNLCPSIKNVLIQYLFECGEIKTIPRSLTKVVGIIRKSCKCNDKIDEEVECILNLSASMKQVLLDVIPENEFDLEFADVYMEDLEESEGDDSCEDNEENTVSNLSDFNEEVGSSGDLIPVDDSDSVRKPESYSLKGLKDANSVWYHVVSFGNGEGVESEKDLSEGGICGNGYLDVQGGCDEVSMEAYRVIGRMLADFAQKEGCELTSHDLRYLGVGSDDFNQNDDGTGKQI